MPRNGGFGPICTGTTASRPAETIKPLPIC
jgi:hypothetical protein